MQRQEIKQQIGDKFIVTGITPRHRRFRQVWSSWAQANCINLWRGSVWLLRDGRRTLIKRVWN